MTLVEVIVVVLVIALAAAVVVPAVGRGADAVRTRAEVSRFAAFLRIAREQAITRGEPQEVSVNPEPPGLTLRTRGSGAIRTRLDLWKQLRVRAEPATATSVTFFPQGPSNGGRFQLEAPGARRYLVTVEPLTGRVAAQRVTQ
jgi:general secretion pathway protein H